MGNIVTFVVLDFTGDKGLIDFKTKVLKSSRAGDLLVSLFGKFFLLKTREAFSITALTS